MRLAHLKVALLIFGMAIVGLAGVVSAHNSVMGHKIPGKIIHGQKADDINNAVMTYIREDTMLKGAFLVFDPVDNKTRSLTLDKLTAVIAMDSGDYLWCGDFKEGKNVIDLDFYLAPQGDKYTLKAIKIHKVNGVERKLLM